NALALSGATIYAGGYFTKLNVAADGTGGVTRNHLAAINADGSLSNWNPSANALVRTLAVSGNVIYAGGAFTKLNVAADGSGGVARSALAAINANGSLSNASPSANNSVYTLLVSNGVIYAGGFFTKMNAAPDGSGGVVRNYLAAFSADGTLTNWNPSADSAILALTSSGGTIYAGGYFTKMNTAADGSGGVARKQLAAINADGSLSNWNPSANDSVTSLLASGSTIYAGGIFTKLNVDSSGGGGVSRNYLAAINTDGTAS